MPLNNDVENILDPILATFDSTLTAEFEDQMAEIYLSGSAEMITWGKTKRGIDIAYEGPPIKQAIDYAKKNGARLVTEMDDVTKKRLANIIRQGIDGKRGVPGLARDIRNGFADMSRYRSQLIAKTETRMALFQASHDRSIDMGVTGKEWVLGAGGESGNCDDCLANAGVGSIPIDEEFPTPEGDIHPACTCAVAPVMLRKG